MKKATNGCARCARTSRQVAGLMEAVAQLGATIEAQVKARSAPSGAEQSVQSVDMLAERSTHSEGHDVSPTSCDVGKAHARSAQCVVVAGQRVGKQQLLDLQRDAARYRWLRDKADNMLGTAAPMVASVDAGGRVVCLVDGEELDAAVDAVMTRPAVRRA